MKKIRSIAVVMIIMSIFSTALASANSLEEEAMGGWTEETGYFENVNNYNNSKPVQRMARAAIRHTGQRETSNATSTTRFRAHGWTTWSGTYHYTRARMENSGAVLTDSGRKWGSNGTEAISPWHSYNPYISNQARTYYGR